MNPLLPPAELDVPSILRGGNSSFLPAFLLLPRERRRDLELFYAFCKTVDDIADAGDHSSALRGEALKVWREGFFHPDLHGLPRNLCELVRRRSLDRGLFLELLEGVATDLAEPVRMTTRGELDRYCHRVAGTVGRLCLPIFDANPQRAADYAETLGRALQYTNILRDTAWDLRRDRIYYPLDELCAAGVSEAAFPAGAGAYLSRFAEETQNLFLSAARMLPAEDRGALKPARIMAAIYGSLLRKMQRDGLRVTEKNYRLSPAKKLAAIGAVLLAGQ